MNSGFGRGKPVIDLKEAVSKISSEALLEQYFGITEIPTTIISPYRLDNHPSLSIYYNSAGKVCFKDFGTGDYGSIIDLLAKVWNKSFEDTVLEILKNNPVKTVFSLPKAKTPKHINSSSDIQVKTRKWKDYDLEYWEMYGISLEWLQFGEVYPVSRIFFTNSFGETKIFPADKYAYCYVERKDDKVTLKIYQPFSKTNKWMNKHNASVWDLWTQLPETGDKLIITSSRKDALCLWENTGIPSVSLQGEGYIPKEHVVNQLKHRFKKIYVLYDNDFKSETNWGREHGKKLCETFDLIQLELPEHLGSKDPSDLVKNHGRQFLNKTINKLINDTEFH